MNYLHLLAMTKDFQLDWPDSFSFVSSSAASGSFFSVNIVPFQCLLRFDYFQRLSFFLLLPAAGVVLPFVWYGIVFVCVGIRKALCGKSSDGDDGSRGEGGNSGRRGQSSTDTVGRTSSRRMREAPLDPVEVTLDHNGGVAVRRPAFLTDRVSQRRAGNES